MRVRFCSYATAAVVFIWWNIIIMAAVTVTTVTVTVALHLQKQIALCFECLNWT